MPMVEQRKRGRPLGSRVAIESDESKYLPQHFMFVRAVMQGMELRDAWDRYVPADDSLRSRPDAGVRGTESDDPADLRVIGRAYRELATGMLALAELMDGQLKAQTGLSQRTGSSALASPPHSDLYAEVRGDLRAFERVLVGTRKLTVQQARAAFRDCLASSQANLRAALPHLAARNHIARREFVDLAGTHEGVPSFDTFREGYPSYVGEKEILERYAELLERTGRDDAAAHITASLKSTDKISLVARLQLAVQAGPIPDSPCALWLSPQLTGLLSQSHVRTLGQLTDLLNSRGVRWHTSLTGIGPTQAKALKEWVMGCPALLKLVPRLSSSGRRGALPSPTGTGTKVTGMVPLAALYVPPPLDGMNGQFRSTANTSTLRVSTDLEAIVAWLGLQRNATSRRSYEKEVTRFYLWCILERRMALSDLTVEECKEFRGFLANVPDHWRMRSTYPRGHPEWRPFSAERLSSNSQAYALNVIGNMFHALQNLGHLTANAMREIAKGSRQTETMDTTRALPFQTVAIVRDMLDGLETDNVFARRRKAVIELMLTTGMRRSEIERATWGKVRRAMVDGGVSADYVITVIGKRDVQRLVPLLANVHALLLTHHQDMLNHSPAVACLPEADHPLIAALEMPVHQITADVSRRSAPSPNASPEIRNPIEKSTELAHLNGALSASGIYQLVRSFLRQAAQHPSVPDEHRPFLAAASVHWFRHTFAHAVLRGTQGDINAVQKLLGHKNISTTATYLRQDESARVKAARLAQSGPSPAHLGSIQDEVLGAIQDAPPK